MLTVLKGNFFKNSFADFYLLVYTGQTVYSFILITLDSLRVVFPFFAFSYFKSILAHTCSASPLISVMCSKNFCPFISLFLVTLNSFGLCWVFAARWKLLGPLDCSLPSLADLLLTSAESWLLGARSEERRVGKECRSR